MPIHIINQDITTVKCDAIVNPTDCCFSGSGGTDRAIHKAAGAGLDKACARLPSLAVGDTAITPAFALPCKYVIHTFGPIWDGGEYNEEMLLKSCYRGALITAMKYKLRSIAFPLISSGTFGFPKDKVLKIAMDTIAEFLSAVGKDIYVYICIRRKSSYELTDKLGIEKYMEIGIDEFENEGPVTDLTDFLKAADASFSELLLNLIKKKKMTNADCYSKANVTKQTFAKIKNNKKYKPTKPTVLAFAVALELTLEETQEFLRAAGLSLAHNNTFDMIVEYFIRNRKYDIYEINSYLYDYDQLLLGLS